MQLQDVYNEKPQQQRSAQSSKRAVPTDWSSTPSVSTLATTLGIVSLVLGATELLLTRPASKASGLDEKYSTTLRLFGLREISSGIGLLASEDKQKWLWSRVIGDVIDSAFLGWAFFTERNPESKKKIAITFAVISPIVLADIFSVLRPKLVRR